VTPTSVVEAVRLIATGETTSVEIVESYLERIDQLEPTVRAFAWFDPDRATALARNADRNGSEAGMSLQGVAIGVKDIIDVTGIPTGCGTPILNGRAPANSAATVVKRLERAGAISIGKTVTAELAFAAPGPTTNPWNPGRTPGGSSMGSAAGVAARLFPAAIGTQTNSSTIMPAALCGVVGFKPSAGSIPLAGIMRFSPSLDQVGTFTTNVADAGLLASILTGTPTRTWLEQRPRQRPHFVIARTSEWAGAATSVQQRFDKDVGLLANAGALIEERELPPAFEQARTTHRTIMAYEAACHVEPIVAGRHAEVSDQLNRFLAEGEAIQRSDYLASLESRQRLSREFEAWIGPYDAALTPAAPDEAPTLETTGDPRFCTQWTLIGAPALVLPSGQGPQRLPLGLQLVGGLGRDRHLLATALLVEPLLERPFREGAPS
jgi:Asp-tRNA(Asn)/Glu-tRNA(Gln) amidotransferase A subunit family amidase